MTDPLHRKIVEALDAVTKRENAEKDEVRKEAAAMGSNWAGDEIWTLRRQVAALRKRLTEDKGEL